MRLTMAIWWSLALVWLATSHAGAEPAAAQAARRIDVKGYGATAEAARKDAVHEATAKLRAELLQQNIEHWQPTEAVVQSHLVDGAGYADEEVEIAPLGTQKTWVIHLKIPDSRDLRCLDQASLRQQVAEGRMRGA